MAGRIASAMNRLCRRLIGRGISITAGFMPTPISAATTSVVGPANREEHERLSGIKLA